MLSRRALAVLLASGALARPAFAFPDRPLRLIVPFAPGGSTDVAARLLAEAMGPLLGQNVVVENRAGANGQVASEAVIRSEPDGHVLLVASASTHGVNPAVARHLSFDAVADFAPVTMIGTTPLVLVTSPAFGATTLDQLLARLRLEPGRHSYASAGAGSITHLAGEVFKLKAGLKDIVHIPYRGGGPAMQAVLTGEVAFTIESVASAASLIQGGRVLALAVGSTARHAALPDVPTFAEAGLAGVELATWNMLLAPRATPPERIEQIGRIARAALATDALRTKLANAGTTAIADASADETGRYLAAQIESFRAVVKAARIELAD
ncbi:tripartite tricarboxylate transporter substrate binding protein [Phreatobacter aquaticus]|uniref:Tripartite tricarboxylate transporter substrate binding protein n=1 Tax=Phreatobacter aquaticus TaxID=2570229 RepID=A0A4D7QJK6_9HYPH|nr:tripartite tricarboxylate transporter substrate binding protein [Phreatobacter aquaticus]QCK86821.1 tripartite tricarboxylate transporter substrate binding protein [Phreatobacter aquaticus]